MVPVWIDLNHLLFDLEEHIRLIVGGGVKIELQLAPSLPRIFVDPMLVQRALVQIVTNARDVMPEHGALRLTTSESEVIGGFASGRPELQPGAMSVYRFTTTGGEFQATSSPSSSSRSSPRNRSAEASAWDWLLSTAS